MKKPYALLLLLGGIVLFHCQSTPIPTIRVFLLAGQSNMAGHGRYLPDSLRTLPPRIGLYCQTNQRTPVQRFQYEATTSFGPEVMLAEKLATAFPQDSILLLKCAKSGASLYNAFHPQGSSPERAAVVNSDSAFNDWYAELIQLAHSHSDSVICSMEACFWMQGERDSRYGRAADAYDENLQQFIHALRNDLEAPHLAFISGRVNPPANGRYPHRNQVRRAIESMPARVEHTAWVDCDDLTLHADQLHFNSVGQLELGRRFARTFLELKEGRTQ